MAVSTTEFLSWCTRVFSKVVTVVWMFILISTSRIADSQISSSLCSLSLKFSPPSNYDSEDWGGFLDNKVCLAAFDDYLRALGLRANQTGPIFLNPSEQNHCLSLMETSMPDVWDCGVDKLTNGRGGCSDFTVDEVTKRLGSELRSLVENCQFVNSSEDFKQSCSPCIRSWNGIKGFNSEMTTNDSMPLQTDLCRFAVLVSLISTRVEDDTYINSIHQCLGGSYTDIVFISNLPSERKHQKKIVIGLWIGCSIGIFVVSVTVILIFTWRCLTSTHTEKGSKSMLMKNIACPIVPVKEIYAATDDLNELNVIGEGTAGKVYRGLMSDKKLVAVKHIVNDGHMETFVREVTSLSHVKHRNLVALLGCCVKKDECFLVYQLCPNGSLSEWLFGKDKVLTWIQRLEIAVDSAQALWFLHTYPEGCIVHRDVKPTNILLGENFEAKLSDFGLSKVMQLGEVCVISEVRGTFGYVDPEYQRNSRVNSSGDVYSFGIVLLQILSGKKVINMNANNPMKLNKMAKALTRGGSITEFADPKLQGEYSVEAFRVTLQLALSCTGLKQVRPSMEQVVEKLEEALCISIKTRRIKHAS